MTDFNFKIPSELHTEFKVISIRKKRDMRDILVELIKQYVEKKGDKK